jgi:hypothetical protein
VYIITTLTLDSTISKADAMDRKDTNLVGYSLITNNCSHFIADTMEAGQSDNGLTETMHNITRSTVPIITHIITGTADFFADRYREFEEWMGWST